MRPPPSEEGRIINDIQIAICGVHMGESLHVGRNFESGVTFCKLKPKNLKKNFKNLVKNLGNHLEISVVAANIILGHRMVLVIYNIVIL